MSIRFEKPVRGPETYSAFGCSKTRAFKEVIVLPLSAALSHSTHCPFLFPCSADYLPIALAALPWAAKKFALYIYRLLSLSTMDIILKFALQ